MCVATLIGAIGGGTIRRVTQCRGRFVALVADNFANSDFFFHLWSSSLYTRTQTHTRICIL